MNDGPCCEQVRERDLGEPLRKIDADIQEQSHRIGKVEVAIHEIADMLQGSREVPEAKQPVLDMVSPNGLLPRVGVSTLELSRKVDALEKAVERLREGL